MILRNWVSGVLARLAKRLADDCTGGAAVVIALALPMVIGGFAFGGEAGLWYLTQRKLQNAADMAAFAAGIELRANPTNRQIMEAAAQAAARGTGFIPERGRLRIDVDEDRERVAVRVEETVPRVFTAFFLKEPVTVGARAVAEVTGGVASCVLGLNEDPGRAAITFKGDSRTSVRGCNVHSNSSIDVALSNNGTAEPECASAVQPIIVRQTARFTPRCGGVVAEAAQTDPFENAAAPADPGGSCLPGSYGPTNGNARHELRPGRYCNGLSIRGGATLAPGTYVIERGSLVINAQAAVVGDGVVFVVKGNRDITINGGSDSRLVAPEGGFLIHAANSRQAQINGGSGTKYEGIVYLPNAALDVQGHNDSRHGCVQIVAWEITFTGTADVGIDCRGQYRSIRAARRVRLVE